MRHLVRLQVADFSEAAKYLPTDGALAWKDLGGAPGSAMAPGAVAFWNYVNSDGTPSYRNDPQTFFGELNYSNFLWSFGLR